MGATRFPNGISTEGNTLKMGAETVTASTLTVDTGLSVVSGATVSLNEDPGATAGDVFQATVSFNGTDGDIVIAIWQDDATAATEDTSVSWIAWGT